MPNYASSSQVWLFSIHQSHSWLLESALARHWRYPGALKSHGWAGTDAAALDAQKLTALHRELGELQPTVEALQALAANKVWHQAIDYGPTLTIGSVASTLKVEVGLVCLPMGLR